MNPSSTISILIVIAVFAVVFHVVLPHLLRNAIAEAVLRKRVRKDKIYLTFDDGPDPVHTPRILDTLKQSGIKATFFVVGEAADKHKDILRRIHNEGHSIGSHSQTHMHAWKTLPWTSYGDIRKGMASLAEHGVESKLWRPPYGKASLQTLIYSLRENKDLAYWTGDPQDYDPSNSASSLQNWLNEHATPGSVILLHDGRRTQEGGKNVTPDALEAYFNQTDIPSRSFAAL
ncbi:MAG: polysaccharide deacetylase family protein [Pirellulales bacterium]|nr:polysaccharide deacetylase family protein [Pirellulales bacterium]